MPTVPLTPARGRSSTSGGGLGKKVGGLPVWAWALAGVAAVGLGLYLRKKLGSSTAAAPAAASPTDTSGGGGTSTSPDTSSLDANTQAQEDLAGALNGLIKLLGSGSGTVSSSTTTDASAPAPAATAAASPYDLNPAPGTPIGNLAAGTPGTGTIFINGQNTGIPDTAQNAAAVVSQYLSVYGNQPLPWTPQPAPIVTAHSSVYAAPAPAKIAPAPTRTATYITPAPAPTVKPAVTSESITATSLARHGGVGGKALQ